MIKKHGTDIPLFIGLVLLLTTSVWSAAYYIDYTGGDDTNAGTSTNAAWKHCVGMAGAAGRVATAAPGAGDSIIFKGGVTWPSGCFPLDFNFSGTPAAQIYLTARTSWYTGNTWTRPIFDLGGSINFDLVIDFSGINFVDFDNFDIRHQGWNGSIWTQPSINIYNAHHVNVRKCYIHDWVALTSAETKAGGITLNGTCIGNVLDSNTFYGSAAGNTGMAVYGVSGDSIIVSNNTMSNCILGIGAEGTNYDVYGNEIFNIKQSRNTNLYHENGLYMVYGTGKVHNNIIHDIADDIMMLYFSALSVPTSWLIYNNLVYNCIGTLKPGQLFDVEHATVDGVVSYKIYNNTILSDSGNECFRTGQGSKPLTALEIKNNIFINKKKRGGISPCLVVDTNSCRIAKIDYNVYNTADTAYFMKGINYGDTLFSLTRSKAHGYDTNSHTAIMTFSGYHPLGPQNPAIDSGINLTAIFTTDLAGMTRPSIGPWDIGAYEYVAGTAVAPHIPNRQTLSRTAIRLHDAIFTIALPSSIRSPELTIVDLSGRTVFCAMLNKGIGAMYGCSWPGVRAVGTYIAIVNEQAGGKGAVFARTKFVVGK